MPSDFLLAIDLGAGEGAKIGIFPQPDLLFRETILPKSRYCDTAQGLADILVRTAEEFLREEHLNFKNIRGLGLSTPGLLKSDGTFLLAANLPFLNGHNLKQMLADRTGLPTGIENDANAGGLAEWSVLGVELLYWVFGGGWGGAWISREGEVKFSALDWDGDDASLHYTNEPGYAMPIDKLFIRNLLQTYEVPYERLERVLIEDLKPVDGVLRGPSGSPDHIRAEAVLSGPGRCRLFRAVLGDDDFYERFLDIHEVREMSNPSVAGKHISKLSSMRVEAALNTDRIFGRLLAQATRTMFQQGRKDGLRDGISICLGGKPSYALPYFGPSAQRAMGTMGITGYLRPSIVDERESNANLVGAAVLADQIFRRSRSAG